MIGDITADFSAHEFACRCSQMDCTANEQRAEISRALVMMFLQPLRDYLDGAYVITSGMRCEAHNASRVVGGAPRSLHIPRASDSGWRGFAADGYPADRSRLYDAFAFLESRRPRFLGLLLDKGVIHVSDGFRRADDPPEPVRWIQGLDGRKRTWKRK